MGLQKKLNSEKTAAVRMVNKFHAACLPPPQVALDVATTGATVCKAAEKPKSIAKSLWVPLPYHPLVAKEISRGLAKISLDPDMCEKWEACFNSKLPELRAAWKNSGPHHESTVRSLAKKRKLEMTQFPRSEAGVAQEFLLDNLQVSLAEAPVVVAQQRNVNSDGSSGNHFMDLAVSNVAKVAVAGPETNRTRRSKFKF